jgi:hypothetical protein
VPDKRAGDGEKRSDFGQRILNCADDGADEQISQERTQGSGGSNGRPKAEEEASSLCC